ncbi:MAG: hypothetical protein LBV04_04785 [Deferribacteraceae bacterium]|jgi:hypothetical protein|nr:hypothetical protein [Deferribacteraceae bacterium]
MYKLILQNGSTLTGDFCVYITAASGNKSSEYSLAWFVKHCRPDTKIYHQWEIKYSFTWGESGKLPSAPFCGAQLVDADPNDAHKSTIMLTYTDGAYGFIDTVRRAKQGCLGIFTDGTIPHDKAALGIGIDGVAAFIMQATPNFYFEIVPKFRYWVTFGNYEAGQLLDFSYLNHSTATVQEIIFEPNRNELTIKLNKSNQWEIIE